MGDYDAVETELGKQDFLDDLKVRSSEDSVNRVIDDILGNYLIRNQHSQGFKYFRSRLFSNGHVRLSAPLSKPKKVFEITTIADEWTTFNFQL